MSSARKLIVAALVLCACSDTSESRKPVDPAPVAVVPDAGVAPAGPIATFDPLTGHLDDGPVTPAGTRPATRRAARPIELVLRSTPGGARVFVDGDDKGVTPVLWQGDTGEHVFTFVKKDHAMARYRFFAITSGVVHARLDPVIEDVKTGTPPPELVQPQVPAPPTLVSPDAATPRVMAPPVDAAVPQAPVMIDAASPPAIDAPSGSPVGPTPF